MSKFLIGNIKGPKGDKGEQGATGPKGEQGIQGPVGPAGGVNSVNGKTGDVNIADALGYTPADQEDVLLKGEVDGRNLFVMGDSEPGYLNTNGTINTGNLNGEATSEYIPVSSGETFTSQVWMTVPEKTNSGYYWLIYFGWYSEKSEETFIKLDAFHGGDQIGFYHEDATATAPDSAKYLRVSVRLYVDGKVKLERGSIATDWTPAPEDVVMQSEIGNLADLLTTSKNNIVAAVNEIASMFDMTPPDDLFDYALKTKNYITLVKTNSGTLNTPYKSGLTAGTLGTAMIFNINEYITIIFVAISDSKIFTIAHTTDGWKEWGSIKPS